ncbi:hypothetical protein D9619_009583 [Psilocybe cf. subviscida]|uniref:Uncharacterized protein n=1 Tax=Psilocybe cf. subviscida TaxID=2480587 RepID=A0A8H5BKW0_9AGAR|nr:hypothetical protein D9619_009583 [Psilocybe cf. subviscida]
MAYQQQTQKPAPKSGVSYSDAVKTFNSPDVQDDINNACDRLVLALSAMVQRYDSITKQMHTIDLLRFSAPMTPKWLSMRQDLTEILWQSRTNAGVISGRLKLFCTTVIPMAIRNIDPKSAHGSFFHDENIQVLQSFMNISAEHAALSMNLFERIFRLTARLVNFLAELTRITSRHAVGGQREMSEVSQKLSEFGSVVQQLFVTARETPGSPDSRYIMFTSSRLVHFSGPAHARSRLTRRPIVLDGDLSTIAKAYDQADRKRNEVAHSQYSAQLRQDRADPLSSTHTALAGFVSDLITTSEAGMGLTLSIWSRLRADCSEIYHWTKHPTQTAIPCVVSCYMDTGGTIYAPLTRPLETYAAGVDPSKYGPDSRETR